MAARGLLPLIFSFIFLGVISSSSGASKILLSGQLLLSSRSLTEGNYVVTLRSDYNLVVTDNGNIVIVTCTAGKYTNCMATLQYDGNFLYDANRNLLWSSNTVGGYGFYILVIQPDRNVVLYGPSYWQSGQRSLKGVAP